MATIEEQVEEFTDNLAREMYQMRSRSMQEMTDERWSRIKRLFPGSVRVCREDVLRFHTEDIKAFRASLLLGDNPV